MTTHDGLFFTDTGTDLRPVVFVHGYTCDHTDWDAQCNTLADRYRCIAVDLPGHGQSAVGEPDIARMGRAMANLVTDLDLTDAVIAGHSMGTRVIVEATQHSGTRIRGIVMVDGSRRAATEEDLTRIRAIKQASDFESYAKNLFSQMFTEKTDTAVRERIIARAMAMDADWAMTLHTSTAEYDARKLDQRLATLNHPMQVIQTTTRDDHGGRASLDTGQTTAYTDFLQSHFSTKRSRVDIIAGTGHFPQIEEPAALSDLIHEFAATLD